MRQHPPIMGQTLQGSLFVTLPASLGTRRPVSQLPAGARQVCTRSGAGRLHFLGALWSGLSIDVPALHEPSLHTQPTRLGTLAPLFNDPFRESRDGVERFLLLLHEIGVFNFGSEGIAHRQDLECKTHSQHHSQWWNMENFPFDFRKHVRMLGFTTSKQRYL